MYVSIVYLFVRQLVNWFTNLFVSKQNHQLTSWLIIWNAGYRARRKLSNAIVTRYFSLTGVKIWPIRFQDAVICPAVIYPTIIRSAVLCPDVMCHAVICPTIIVHAIIDPAGIRSQSHSLTRYKIRHDHIWSHMIYNTTAQQECLW